MSLDLNGYITYHASDRNIQPYSFLYKKPEYSEFGFSETFSETCYVSPTMWEAKQWASIIYTWRRVSCISVYAVLLDRLPFGTMKNSFNPTHLTRSMWGDYPISVTGNAIVLRKELELIIKK
jgi:hypothetical protein